MIGIYIRVSSATQVKDGYSLTAQKERLTAYCIAQGWDNYKFYVEEGLSAKNTKRPIYQELMRHVKNKKVSTVLVYKLDRIMRSIGELDEMLKTFDKHECAFKSATEPFDTSNATGKLFIYLVGALAQWEIELSSERISMVLEEKVANEGVWIGNVPYPFDLDKNTQKLVPNERRSKVMLRIIDMIKSGRSSLNVAEHMTKHNNDKVEWSANTVIRLLKNPALYGATRWVDNCYDNTHEGIITRDEFDHIQTILSDRSRSKVRSVKNTYIFQNKVACPVCDKIMRVNRFFRKRADGSSYQGAVLRCNQCAKDKKFNRSPSEDKILKALYRYMRNVQMPKIDDLKINYDPPNFIKELKRIENMRAKFQRAWANDHMTDEEFQARMQETKEKYDELKEKTKDYKEPKPIDLDKIKNTVTTFNENFKMLSNDEKREFISRFFRKIKINVIETPSLTGKYKRGNPKIEVVDVDFY